MRIKLMVIRTMRRKETMVIRSIAILVLPLQIFSSIRIKHKKCRVL